MGSGSNAVNQSNSYLAIGKLADRKILSLFPSFDYQANGANTRGQDTIFGCLACIYRLGISGQISILGLSRSLDMSRPKVAKSLAQLNELGLVSPAKEGKSASFRLTIKGLVALMAFKEFQAFDALKPILCSSNAKGDRLGFALLVVGYSEPKKADAVFTVLVDYAAKGGRVESIEPNAVAESLLTFYSNQCKLNAVSLPNYLGVFKEFTTTGFQQVLQILLYSIKPTAEDYNWLVEFFGEVVEFYYNPARLAYVNLLAQNPALKARLEAFKKSQEQQIRKEGQTMEVTFNVPSSNVQKFMSMPAHLRAVATRLVLEPLQFINQELAFSFWPS